MDYIMNKNDRSASATGLKQIPMMSDISMVSRMTDDSDTFLLYEDVSESSEEDTSSDEDDDSSEASDLSENSSDDDCSIDLGIDVADDLQQSIASMRMGMQKVHSSNSLRSMLSGSGLSGTGGSGRSWHTRRNTPEAASIARQMQEQSVARQKTGDLQKQMSIGNIQILVPGEEARISQTAKKVIIPGSASVGHIGQTLSAQTATTEVHDNAVKPDEFLATLLGRDISKERFGYDQLKGFFLEVKPEYIHAWTNGLTRAIREHDLDTLVRMHQEGKLLQACNKFGESIVHLCVRRGTPEMLTFLLHNAGVSMRVCCENGRTPLHDAAWCLSSDVASYHMLELLLQESPMQMFITDKRGFTPLAYVPRARWNECNVFLEKLDTKGLLPLKPLST